MIGGFLKEVLLFVFAFFLGLGYTEDKTVDSELQQKVQDHMDVIVDESAALVDDVVDEVRKNEHVKKAEEFVNDVNEIVENTANDIDDHFGKEEDKDAEDAADEATETVKDTADEVKETVEDAASEVKETVTEAKDEVTETVEDAAAEAKEDAGK